MTQAIPQSGFHPNSSLAPFGMIPGLSAIYEARKKGLGMFAVDLKPGGVCIISPLPGLSEQIRGSLHALDDVSALFAPNHYHNRGLREYAEAFPSARLIAPAPAIPRLERITGLSFVVQDELAKILPEGMDLLEPDGLKTGENWLRVRGKKGVAWIVVDAFCGPKGTQPGSNEPEILKTFPKFGVGDRACYVRWVERQIRRDKPKSLLPCHGLFNSSREAGGKIARPRLEPIVSGCLGSIAA